MHCHRYSYKGVNTDRTKYSISLSKIESVSYNLRFLPVQRYYYYIRKGVQKKMLAPQPSEQLRAIQRLVPQKYLTSHYLSNLRDELLEEIDSDYEFSARKSIG